MLLIEGESARARETRPSQTPREQEEISPRATHSSEISSGKKNKKNRCFAFQICVASSELQPSEKRHEKKNKIKSR